MSDHQNILIVEVDPEEYEPIASLLKRINFDVDRLPTAGGALELVSAVPFSAVILGYPLEKVSIEGFLESTKNEGSASKQAAVALLSPESKKDESAAFLDTGVDLVMMSEDEVTEKERKLCKLLGILPRKAVRMLIKLDITLEDAKRDNIVAQTEDISASGLFVSTGRLYPIGSRARVMFSLPDDPAPVSVEVEVTRHAGSGPGGRMGMGFKFVDSDESVTARIRDFLSMIEQGG